MEKATLSSDSFEATKGSHSSPASAKNAETSLPLQLQAEDPAPERVSRPRYTLYEDLSIIRYIIEAEGRPRLGGYKFWKRLANDTEVSSFFQSRDKATPRRQ